MVSGDQNAQGFIDLTESFDIDYLALYYDGFDQVYEDMASGALDAGVFFNLYQLSQPDMSPTSIIFQPNNSYFAVPEGADREILDLIDRTLVSWKSDKQSFYYTEVMELLSTAGTWEFPKWLVFLIIGLFSLALAALIFIRMLRLQVRQRTADLLAAQESYRSTFVEADVGMCHVAADGRLLRVNPWLCSYLGYDEKSLLSMKFSDLTHELDMESSQDAYRSIVENHRTSYRINKRYVSKDGRVLWAHVTATGIRDSEERLSYIAVLIEDINARLEAEEMVDDLQKRYRSMFNDSYQMTALFDEAGRLLDVNQTLKKICRLPDTLEGSLGKTPSEVEWFGTIGSLRVQEMLDECLMTGQPIRHTLGLEDTGTGMALDMTVKPIFDEEQKIRYCVTEAHDVTDMITLTNSLEQQVDARTREIRDAQDRLVESEKLAALGRLVAGIAHEINTPLGVAKTGASYLLEQVSDTKRRFNEQALSKEDFLHMLDSFAELGEILEKNLEKAAILIRDFKLTSTDQSNQELKMVSAKEYIEAVMHSLNGRFSPLGIDWTVEADEDEHPMYIAVMNQILVNLALNSVSHAFPDGHGGHIRIVYKRTDGNYRLEYQDNGKGISEEFLNHIFEPFFTTERGRGFPGLGLNIVHNLVKDILKGDIQCTVPPGGGVAFIMEFPVPA
jgi:PAS domain S-box-containing protein